MKYILLVFIMIFLFFGGDICAQEMMSMSPQRNLVHWLTQNVFDDKMPRSYAAPKDWHSMEGLDEMTVDGIVERMIIANGVSVYDGSIRQMLLASVKEKEASYQADIYTQTLLSATWKNLAHIRAFPYPFRYQGKELDRKEAYFFRIISPDWQQPDPMSGVDHFSGFPGPDYDPDLIVWADWKPITGENAWVGIGALQTAYFKYAGDFLVMKKSDEMKLALSIVCGVDALVSPIGAIFHAASGTYKKDPFDISNENNISVYVFLKMLLQVTGDEKYAWMMGGLQNYFKTYAYDSASGLFWQGGFYQDGAFTPTQIMAVDVQTWAIAALGPKTIDAWYGEGTAHRMWVETKRRAGYWHDGKLSGVGFTDGHDILSGEWSYGAVAAVLELALYYKDSDPVVFRELMADVVDMIHGLEMLAVFDGSGKSYLYANKRFKIPFGWYANPLPSTSSTVWAYFIQTGFCPFRLGGKSRWLELEDFAKAVGEIH